MKTTLTPPPSRKKTAYVLKIRPDDQSPWSDPTYYRKRRTRDEDAAANRILGGMRTWSYEERLTTDQFEELCD